MCGIYETELQNWNKDYFLHFIWTSFICEKVPLSHCICSKHGCLFFKFLIVFKSQPGSYDFSALMVADHTGVLIGVDSSPTMPLSMAFPVLGHVQARERQCVSHIGSVAASVSPLQGLWLLWASLCVLTTWLASLAGNGCKVGLSWQD